MTVTSPHATNSANALSTIPAMAPDGSAWCVETVGSGAELISADSGEEMVAAAGDSDADADAVVDDVASVGDAMTVVGGVVVVVTEDVELEDEDELEVDEDDDASAPTGRYMKKSNASVLASRFLNVIVCVPGASSCSYRICTTCSSALSEVCSTGAEPSSATL